MIVAGTGTNKDSDREESGDTATKVGLLEVRGIAFHPLGGYFLATHAGGDIWYVDQDGEARLFIQGNSANAHNPRPFRVPANDENEISEPRSVSVSQNGDVIIATNDAGFIRIVRNILPPPAPPLVTSAVLQPNSRLRLEWQTEPGKWYLLDESSTLEAGTWSGLDFRPAAGTALNFTVPVDPLSPRHFYRVHSIRRWPN
jgi:hypothetical protein